MYVEIDHLSTASILQFLFQKQGIVYPLTYFNSLIPKLHVSKGDPFNPKSYLPIQLLKILPS